jgi:hypothetical protein
VQQDKGEDEEEGLWRLLEAALSSNESFCPDTFVGIEKLIALLKKRLTLPGTAAGASSSKMSSLPIIEGFVARIQREYNEWAAKESALQLELVRAKAEAEELRSQLSAQEPFSEIKSKSFAEVERKRMEEDASRERSRLNQERILTDFYLAASVRRSLGIVLGPQASKSK